MSAVFSLLENNIMEGLNPEVIQKSVDEYNKSYIGSLPSLTSPYMIRLGIFLSFILDKVQEGEGKDYKAEKYMEWACRESRKTPWYYRDSFIGGIVGALFEKYCDRSLFAYASEQYERIYGEKLDLTQDPQTVLRHSISYICDTGFEQEEINIAYEGFGYLTVKDWKEKTKDMSGFDKLELGRQLFKEALNSLEDKHNLLMPLFGYLARNDFTFRFEIVDKVTSWYERLTGRTLKDDVPMSLVDHLKRTIQDYMSKDLTDVNRFKRQFSFERTFNALLFLDFLGHLDSKLAMQFERIYDEHPEKDSLLMLMGEFIPTKYHNLPFIQRFFEKHEMAKTFGHIMEDARMDPRLRYSREEKQGILVRIEDVGSQGDGIAHVNGKRIYVNGAKKGQNVRIRIIKIDPMGEYGFAEIIN